LNIIDILGNHKQKPITKKFLIENQDKEKKLQGKIKVVIK